MTNIDWSQSLASILRQSTRDAHEAVERSPGAIALLNGQLSRNQYAEYLEMLWYIYERAPALAEDVAYLLQVPLSSWLLAHRGCRAPTQPAALARYITRVRTLAEAKDPTPLLAHAYVRYLGDLSGGQTIRRRITKAYDLNEEDGLGTRFYEFNTLGSSSIANQGEMKRIKEWFREGLNTAGNLGLDVKVAVCKEADLAFNLNTGLFNAIPSLSSPLEPSPRIEHPGHKTEKHLKLPAEPVEKGLLVRTFKVALLVSLVYLLAAVGGLFRVVIIG